MIRFLVALILLPLAIWGVLISLLIVGKVINAINHTSTAPHHAKSNGGH